MGQYYVQVNLNKQQCLNTHAFGDGLKLMEFGPSPMGTMLAMAILLADGNGRGGGDLHIEPLGGEEHPEMNKLDGKARFGVNGDPHKLVGSWAGDRIVIAGDYADEEPRWVPELLERYWKDLKSSAIKCPYAEGYENKAPTLYHLADLYFDDISLEMIDVIRNDEYVRGDWDKKDPTKFKDKEYIRTVSEHRAQLIKWGLPCLPPISVIPAKKRRVNGRAVR